MNKPSTALADVTKQPDATNKGLIDLKIRWNLYNMGLTTHQVARANDAVMLDTNANGLIYGDAGRTIKQTLHSYLVLLNPLINEAQTASLPVLAKDVTWDGFYFPIEFKTQSAASGT